LNSGVALSALAKTVLNIKIHLFVTAPTEHLVILVPELKQGLPVQPV